MCIAIITVCSTVHSINCEICNALTVFTVMCNACGIGRDINEQYTVLSLAIPPVSAEIYAHSRFVTWHVIFFMGAQRAQEHWTKYTAVYTAVHMYVMNICLLTVFDTETVVYRPN